MGLSEGNPLIVVLEHLLAAIMGTSLSNLVVGHNLQDLWLWFTDIGLLPWSLGIALLIFGILFLVRYATFRPRSRNLLLFITALGLVSLVVVATSLAPPCGAYMRFQVRTIAPNLTGGCIGSYATNGRSYFEFETETDKSGGLSYHVLSVTLQTFGENQDQYRLGEAALGLEFSSGIYITLPERRGRDFSRAKRLSFEIRGTVGAGGLGISAKDVPSLYGGSTEVKVIKAIGQQQESSGISKIGEWTEEIVDLKEFAFKGYKVDFSRLGTLSFFTTNSLSDTENVEFKIRNIHLSGD